MALINCPEAEKCPKCAYPINSQQFIEKKQSKKPNRKWFIGLLVGGIIFFYWVNSGSCDDGTCYQGFYERKGITSQYATYIFFGEINGEKSIYRCSKVMGVKINKAKAISEKRIKDENGNSTAINIRFPYDKTMDESRWIKWNGKWKCDGCKGVISPNGEYFTFKERVDLYETEGKGLNWEAFWNR